MQYDGAMCHIVFIAAITFRFLILMATYHTIDYAKGITWMGKPLLLTKRAVKMMKVNCKVKSDNIIANVEEYGKLFYGCDCCKIKIDACIS